MLKTRWYKKILLKAYIYTHIEFPPKVSLSDLTRKFEKRLKWKLVFEVALAKSQQK
jgi:hypothetical protein